MTNEEKQEIVNEVLAALHTHGKTIGQLTPVTSPSDSDTFELSGGRNLSYGKLKELITAIFTAALNGYVPADALWEYIQQYVAKLGDNGALDWQESPVVMLATMGTTLDNVDGELPAYTLQEGDMYYQYGVNYQIFRKLSDHEEGLPAKTGVVYFNLRTWRTYQWTGSTMVEIAKPKKRVVLADLHTQAYPSMEVGTIAYNPIAKKIVEKVSSTSWSLSDPDPDCIYCDAQTGTSIRWDTASSAWVSIGGNINVVNNLVEGGGDKALSAEMGVLLKRNVDAVQANIVKLYNKLANMAFWDAADQAAAEPTALDGSVPKVTVTITNSIGIGAVIKRGGTVVSGSLQVDQGDELVLTVEPADADTELSNVTAAIDGGTATALVNNTLTIAHVNTNTSIVFAGTAASWDTVPKSDVVEGSTVVRYGMQQGRSVAPLNTSNPGVTTVALCQTDNSKPAVILMPAGEPHGEKVIVQQTGLNSPGNTTQFFFATAGKRYLNVKVIGGDVTGTQELRLAVACYLDSVVDGYSYSIANVSSRFVTRVAYTPQSSQVWKIDLFAAATSAGKQAGDIKYVKLLLAKYVAPNSSNEVDSQTYYDGLTVKYKFTDD